MSGNIRDSSAGITFIKEILNLTFGEISSKDSLFDEPGDTCLFLNHAFKWFMYKEILHATRILWLYLGTTSFLSGISHTCLRYNYTFNESC